MLKYDKTIDGRDDPALSPNRGNAPAQNPDPIHGDAGQ
jgi:hypothetical protein